MAIKTNKNVAIPSMSTWPFAPLFSDRAGDEGMGRIRSFAEAWRRILATRYVREDELRAFPYRWALLPPKPRPRQP